MRRLLRVWLAVLVLVAPIQIEGCSSALQESNGTAFVDTHPRLPVDPWDFEKVPIGAPITITMHGGGARRSGRFEGFEQASDSAYAARYAAWRAQAPLGTGFRLGATVHWTTPGGGDDATFAGYDLYSVRLIVPPDTVPHVLPARDLFGLRGPDNTMVSGAALGALFDAGLLPVKTRLRLRRAGHVDRIDLEQVASIRVNGIPTAVGLAVVLGGVIAVLVIAAHQPHSAPSNDCDTSEIPTGWMSLGPALEPTPSRLVATGDALSAGAAHPSRR